MVRVLFLALLFLLLGCGAPKVKIETENITPQKNYHFSILSWSPSGRQAATAGLFEDELFLINFDGNETSKIKFQTQSFGGAEFWSDDELIYSELGELDATTFVGTAMYYSYKIPTGESVFLFETWSGYEFLARPNESQIVFEASRGYSNFLIYSYSLTTQQIEPVFDPGDAHFEGFDLDASGRYLVVSAVYEALPETSVASSTILYVVDLETRIATPIIERTADGYRDPVWSPDGNWVWVIKFPASGTERYSPSLEVLSKDGETRLAVTFNQLGLSPAHIEMSPNSLVALIATVGSPAGNELFVVDLQAAFDKLVLIDR